MQDMSTISGMFTPLSKLYSETSNSDEYSDYYYNLSSNEKHADSIISSEQAKKIFSKKEHGEDHSMANEKNHAKTKIATLRKETQGKIGEIIKQFSKANETLSKKIKDQNDKHWVIGSPFTPLEFFEKSSELQAKEEHFRQEMKKKYENQKKNIIKSFEEKKNKLIDEKRETIQKLWRSKMFDLNGKLQQAEWEKSTKKNEEEEKFKEKYEKLYKEALGKEKILLLGEIDEHFNNQFQEKLKIICEEKRILKNDIEIEKVKNQIQDELKLKKNLEMNKWEDEKNKFAKEIAKRISEDEDIQAKEFETLTKEQIKEEIAEIIIEAAKDITKDYEQNLASLKLSHNERIKNFHDAWINDIINEWKEEQDNIAKSSYKEEITTNIIKDLEKSLKNSTDFQLLQDDQEKIYRQVSDELSHIHEFYRKEIDNIYKNQLNEIEEQFLENFNQKIKQEADKKITQKEKELYIKFVHKLEKLKNAKKHEFEEHFSSDLKVRNK